MIEVNLTVIPQQKNVYKFFKNLSEFIHVSPRFQSNSKKFRKKNKWIRNNFFETLNFQSISSENSENLE